jgi:hypothetical protein
MGTFILRNFRPGEESTINGRTVAGQFASYAEVCAFSRLSNTRRYAVPAAVRRSQRIDLRRRPISRR